MLRSMFSGVSGLRTHQSKMDVIGNNIANVNTAGFKSGRATFMDSIYQAVRNSTAGTKFYGGSNPSQLGYGSQLASVDVNFTAGSYEPTGYATDCMIGGNGFFLVGPKIPALNGGDIDNDGIVNDTDPATPDAEGSKANTLILTRVGKFTVDGNGYLVDANGNVVYGFLPVNNGQVGQAIEGETPWTGKTDRLVPLRVPCPDAGGGTPSINYDDKQEPLKLTGIAIDENGIISGKATDANGKEIIYKIGQVAVANVPNPNALENQGNSYYKAVNNTGLIGAYAPGEGTTATLVTNGLEMANVDLATEFSSMITTQRGFQACSKMITVSDEMLQELVNMKR